MAKYADELYSDLHKDAYGFRPSEGRFERWDALSEAEKQAEWDQLQAQVLENIKERETREAAAVVEFEAQVGTVLAAGAKTRKQAVAWLMDAEDIHDEEHFEWKQGLPFGYLRRTA